MRSALQLRLSLTLTGLTLTACSLRDAPELGKGGSGGGAGGGATLTECEGSLVDLLANPDHCGVCNHACASNSCIQGSCQTALATDGAWGLAIDEGNLYWTHAAVGPIERISGTNQSDATVTVPAQLYWDIQAKGSVVVVAPVDPVSFDFQPPQLFSWGDMPTTPLCEGSPCQAVIDLAADNTIFAWGAADGIWYYDSGQIVRFSPSPTIGVAYGRVKPFPQAIVDSATGKLSVAPNLEAMTLTQLDATPVGFPTTMVFAGHTLFWLENDASAPFRLRCADVSAQPIVPIDYAKLPAGSGNVKGPNTLWVAPEATTDGWLYVAFAGGTIGRARPTCEPHDSLEILFDLNETDLGADASWFIAAMRTNNTPDGPLHFTVSSPTMETELGGLYTRHVKAPPLRTLKLEL